MEVAELKTQVKIIKRAKIWHLMIDDQSIFRSNSLSLVEQYGLSHFMVMPEKIITELPVDRTKL